MQEICAFSVFLAGQFPFPSPSDYLSVGQSPSCKCLERILLLYIYISDTILVVCSCFSSSSVSILSWLHLESLMMAAISLSFPVINRRRRQSHLPPRTLPIQAQWNIGSFTMERRECSNDNSVSASPSHGCTVGSSQNASYSQLMELLTVIKCPAARGRGGARPNPSIIGARSSCVSCTPDI